MTDEQIRSYFGETSDFIVRKLNCCGYSLYAYGVDGLVSGGTMSDYVLKPIGYADFSLKLRKALRYVDQSRERFLMLQTVYILWILTHG